MDNVEFVYTVGMDEADVAWRLRENASAVLSPASGGVAHGVPVSYHYDEAEINDLFDPVRVFDEDVSDVRIRVAELTPTEVTGRTTAPGQ